jgi:hypothetical protein
VAEPPKKNRAARPIIVVSQPKIDIPGLEGAVDDPLPFLTPGSWRKIEPHLRACPFAPLRDASAAEEGDGDVC